MKSQAENPKTVSVSKAAEGPKHAALEETLRLIATCDCSRKPCDLCRERIASVVEQNKQLAEALREIAKGEGAYSMDRLEHASNTIDNMKQLAEAALRLVRE